MKGFIIFFSLVFLINYIQNQKPENITMFDILVASYGYHFYEFTILKNEIFGFEFELIRGVPNRLWSLTGSSKIQFLYYSIYDYIWEEYKKEEEEAIANSIEFRKNPWSGGSYYY